MLLYIQLYEINTADPGFSRCRIGMLCQWIVNRRRRSFGRCRRLDNVNRVVVQRNVLCKSAGSENALETLEEPSVSPPCRKQNYLGPNSM